MKLAGTGHGTARIGPVLSSPKLYVYSDLFYNSILQIA